MRRNRALSSHPRETQAPGTKAASGGPTKNLIQYNLHSIRHVPKTNLAPPCCSFFPSLLRNLTRRTISTLRREGKSEEEEKGCRARFLYGPTARRARLRPSAGGVPSSPHRPPLPPRRPTPHARFPRRSRPRETLLLLCSCPA